MNSCEGIRTDENPQRMYDNVVAGSNDMGFMYEAQDCASPTIFNNEAFASVVGFFLRSRREGYCQGVTLLKAWKAAHIGLFVGDIAVPTRISHVTVADCHLGIVPFFAIHHNFRRLWVQNSNIIGTTPGATECSASAFCRTQSATDPDMTACKSIFAPVNFRRVGFVIPLNMKLEKLCGTVGRVCEQMSPAYPSLSCFFPWEYHNHMDKGLGWAFFEGTTFAYWRASECHGRTSRAIATSVSAAEIQFPLTFSGTRWHQADVAARFELSAEKLNDAFADRKAPCRTEEGGCMGLDQALYIISILYIYIYNYIYIYTYIHICII